MRRELMRRIEKWELEVLGYKVNRRQQILNVSTLLICIAIFMSIILYLEYMPNMVMLILK